MQLKKTSGGYQSAKKYFSEEEIFTAVTSERTKRKWDNNSKSYTDEIEAYVYSFAYEGCQEILEVKFSEPQPVTQFQKYKIIGLQVFEDWSSNRAYFKGEALISC